MNQRSQIPPGSRAEAKRRTRRILLEAGLAECSEHGLEAPSLDAICSRAGFTRGAFYVHFKDRDDFLVALFDWVLAGVLDALVGPEDEQSVDAVFSRFADAVSTGLWPMQEGRRVPTERIAEALERSVAIRERCVDLLQRAVLRLTKVAMRGQESADLRRDISASQIAQILITLATGALSLRQARVPMDVRRLRSEMMTLIERRPRLDA